MMKPGLAACMLALVCGCGPGLTTIAKAINWPMIGDLYDLSKV